MFWPWYERWMPLLAGDTLCSQPDGPGRLKLCRCPPEYRRKLRIQDRRCYLGDPTPAVRLGYRKIQHPQEIEVLRREMPCLQYVARGTATATIGEKQCGFFVGVATNDS